MYCMYDFPHTKLKVIILNFSLFKKNKSKFSAKVQLNICFHTVCVIISFTLTTLSLSLIKGYVSGLCQHAV